MNSIVVLPKIQEATDEVRLLHQELMGGAKVTIEKAIRIGELLTGIKASLKHGQWLPWVSENLEFDRTQASRYMAVFTNRNDDRIHHLGFTDAYKLLSDGGREKAPHVSHNSGENEWYTPPEFVEASRMAMGGIDCDPASSAVANRTVKAAKFFDKQVDGLKQKWSGRVFLNPPYVSNLIGQFAEAVASKYALGEITQACVLVNNATETEWFLRITSEASAICFPSSRIRFRTPNEEELRSPLQGQAIIYLGARQSKFFKAFKAIGFCCHIV